MLGIIKTIQHFWAQGLLNKMIIVAGAVVLAALIFKAIKVSLKILFYVALTVLIVAGVVFLLLKFF